MRLTRREMVGGRGRDKGVAAFTLIEVLVVVAMIALLVSILLPSLHRARESARTVKCMANLSNLPKAAISFAAEHKGYGQLIGQEGEWKAIDPNRSRYEYQQGGFGTTTPQIKSWPVAYAKNAGIPTLRNNSQFEECFSSTNVPKDPSYFWRRFGRYDVYLCPSDKSPIHNVWCPNSASGTAPYATLSYATNEDVFGVTEPPNCNPPHIGANEGQPWADGKSGDGPGVRAKRLEGRMDKIIRPSEVVIFCDGGNEDHGATDPMLLITNNAAMHGPYLENYEYCWGRLPHFRHSDKGSVATAFADGSGKNAKPIEWKPATGKKYAYVKRYSPRIRVSPYEVGVLDPNNQP